EILELLVREHGEVVEYQLDLAGTYLNMGNLVRDRPSPKESLRWYDRVFTVLDRLRKRDAELQPARAIRLRAHRARAEARSQLGRHRQAADDWKQAADLESEDKRRDCLLQRTMALARAGDHEQAGKEAERLPGGKGLKGESAYNLACVYALAAAAVRRDKKLTSSEQSKNAEQHAARAMQLLQRIQRDGFFKGAENAKQINVDSDLTE